MSEYNLKAASECAVNDIEGASGRAPDFLKEKLANIILGIGAGNRDKPLYSLSQKAFDWVNSNDDHSEQWVFELISHDDFETNEGFVLGKLNHVLLNFLISMDGFSHAESVIGAFDEMTQCDQDRDEAIKKCANTLSRELYHYRTKHLPREPHRQKFTDLNKFLKSHGRHEPINGDPLLFWSENADRKKWTLYKTVHESMVTLCEIIEEERSSSPVEALHNIGEDEDEISAIDMAVENISFDGDLADQLKDALLNIEDAEVPLFKKSELASLNDLASLGRHGYKWARSSACLLSLYPYQASIVQLIKNSAEKPKIVTAAACPGENGYEDVLKGFEKHIKFLWDVKCFCHLYKSDEEGCEIDPALSIRLESFVENKFSLLRRKDIRDLPKEKIASAITDLEDDINILLSHISLILRFWKTDMERELSNLFNEDKETFSTKLKSLYSLEDV